ncbi:hypothetical protein TWF696_002642 [Orbilia brochopaga]|uniref:Uncharacterized protein n=1 Tax=Orbilia brochopaga TaxID=3140254 RepID=A0AAV9U265_9PEZI
MDDDALQRKYLIDGTVVVSIVVISLLGLCLYAYKSPNDPGYPTKYRTRGDSPTRPKNGICMSYLYDCCQHPRVVKLFYVDLHEPRTFFQEMRRYNMAGVAIIPYNSEGWLKRPGKLFLVDADDARDKELFEACNGGRAKFIAVYPPYVEDVAFTTDSPRLREIVEPHPSWVKDGEALEPHYGDIEQLLLHYHDVDMKAKGSMCRIM